MSMVRGLDIHVHVVHTGTLQNSIALHRTESNFQERIVLI